MTATVTPYRSPLPAGRDGFAQLVRSEWTKLRTVRGWVIGLVVAALVTVLFSWFAASGSHSSICTGPGPNTCTGSPPLPLGPGGVPVSDSYTFMHRQLEGNGTVTARVTSLTGVRLVNGNRVAANAAQNASNTRPGLSPWAKAGVMITGSTKQGSPYAAVMVTGSHGIRMQDNYTHDTAGPPRSVSPGSPVWLRLTRTGTTVTAYDSADGVHWTGIGAAHLAGLGSTVNVGAFVTSPLIFDSAHSNGTPSLATAVFDHLSANARGGWTGGVIQGADDPMMPGAAYHRSGGVFTLSGSGDIAPSVAGSGGGQSVSNSLLLGAVGGLIVLVVVGTLFITSEYRRGLIRTSFVASPRRGRVLLAKAVVVGSVAFGAGLVGTLIALPLSRSVLRSNGNAVFPSGTSTDIRMVVGTAALLAAAAILALALGTMLRRGAAAVTAAVLIIVLPIILASTLPAGAADWLLRLTPAAAFSVQQTAPHYSQVASAYTPVNGYYPLSSWVGFVVLCAYAAAALGGAAWLLQRRDA